MDLDDEELKVTRMMNGADRNSRVRVNNDIEVNEYVRTADGKIGKILKYENFEYHIKIDKDETWKCAKDYIVKHSKILSEVVEVGDFVNGKLIHKIDKGPNYCYLYYGNCKTFVDYQIKTIITKEIYMANCYKVGGE